MPLDVIVSGWVDRPIEDGPEPILSVGIAPEAWRSAPQLELENYFHWGPTPLTDLTPLFDRTRRDQLRAAHEGNQTEIVLISQRMLDDWRPTGISRSGDRFRLTVDACVSTGETTV